jgi:phosphate/sulfate permease
VATGANDVANSFSTAVAAKTITHRQAIVLAFFAEFTGAMVLGSSVTGAFVQLCIVCMVCMYVYDIFSSMYDMYGMCGMYVCVCELVHYGM